MKPQDWSYQRIDEIIYGIESILTENSIHATHQRKMRLALDILKGIEITTTKKLLIFDLNGVLVESEFVPNMEEKREGWTRVGKSLRRPFPFAITLFERLFSEEGKKHFRVALWSSVFVSNLEKTVKGCFPQFEKDFLFLYGQEQCLSQENPNFDKNDKNSKPTLFWKVLDRVWDEFPQFNKTNTTIIDDSAQKLEKNPEECCIVIDSQFFEETIINVLV